MRITRNLNATSTAAHADSRRGPGGRQRRRSLGAHGLFEREHRREPCLVVRFGPLFARALPGTRVDVLHLDGIGAAGGQPQRELTVRIGRDLLAPAPGGHRGHGRAFARGGWWNGATIYRVQDNYVAQWGGGDDKTTLPPTVIENPPAEYEWARFDGITSLAKPDSYAVATGHSADGWPLATDGKTSWLTHCYGMVGVARDLAPSTGSGAELYTVIGHAPRHLDRNIALVGRVIEGIQWLSSLPRGGGNLGVYEDPAERPVGARLRLVEFQGAARGSFGLRDRSAHTRAPGQKRGSARRERLVAERRMPVFGIGAGMQLLNVSL